MLADTLRGDSLKADAPCLSAVVVARDAVLVNSGQLCSSQGSLRGRRRRQAWTGSEYRGQRGSNHTGQQKDGDRGYWILSHVSHHSYYRPVPPCRAAKRLVTNKPTGSRTRGAQTRPDSPSGHQIPLSAWLPRPRSDRAPCSKAESGDRISCHTSRTVP